MIAAPAIAQRDLAKIPSADPADERAAFEVAEGLEVTLWAAEPLVYKPIQMNWDEHGRLWVACSSVYPQIEPGQVANDKILVLEDTDGDGRADESTVFAEGLLIPTGIAPGDGGVLRRQQHRDPPPEGHRRRRQGRRAPGRPLGLRDRGYAPYRAYVPMGI